MARLTKFVQGVSTFEVATLAAFAEVIAGLTYYRLKVSDFATPFFKGWGQVAFSPGEREFPSDGAGARAANVGAAVKLVAHRLCMWPVDANATVLPNGAALDSNTCLVIAPGQTVDLGDWPGDVLFREQPDGAILAGANWQTPANQAIIGTAVTVVIDPLLSLGGDSADREHVT